MVELVVTDGIAHLTLARPDEGNGINRRLCTELRTHAESLAERDDVRAVVLRGAGKNFCVGGDLSYFKQIEDLETEIRALADDFHAGIGALRALDAPVIAAVQGAAAGGGLSLAIACDIVLAAESAKLTMAYTAAGLSPDGGSSWTLPRIVGLKLATEMMLTNRRLTAAEALAAGLVTRVVADDALDAEADALAATLAAGATGAYGTVKRLLASSFQSTLEEQFDAEAAGVAANAASPDGREGVAAFLAKRRPQFGAAATLGTESPSP
jgi:2-(1,2-epoxy-1,2-dihydrophenyl)acetyl-CoA isomerase